VAVYAKKQHLYVFCLFTVTFKYTTVESKCHCTINHRKIQYPLPSKFWPNQCCTASKYRAD